MADSYSTLRPLIDGKILTIKLLDRRLVEPEHIQRVGDEVKTVLHAFDQRKVILDFEVVEFLSSSMLSVIITAHAIVGDRDGEMVVADLSKDLLKMFKMMRLHTRIPVHKTVDKAKKALAD